MTYSIDETRNNRAIALWLLVICALIFSMVVLGGVTRLTRSGLSMVEWKPVMGILPPISQQEWVDTFNKYKLSPEYSKVNFGMSLEDFKSIFYFEYGHRVLGRLIGLTFLIPFLYFLIRGRIKKRMTLPMITMFILGGLQGLLGWYMVKSGLVNDPHVSQYRLTAHLTAAIAIYSYILWYALTLLRPEPENCEIPGFRKLRGFGIGVSHVIVLMIISGGFVAGTKAGLTYNTFPLMGDRFIPEASALFSMSPWYINFFENIITIQFDHRMIAWLLMIMVPIYWWKIQKSEVSRRTRMISQFMLIIFIGQITLGITTLVQAVPVPIAAAHQAGALLLLTMLILMNHEMRKAKKALED